jgi:predicted RND superfamily exporter protein
MMVLRGEDLLKNLTPKDAPPDMITAVTGIYRNLPLTRASLMSDLTRTFSLGIGLMLLVIMLQFRRLRAILLLMIPLAMGSLWALGIFAWMSPQLNLISAAGFIILAGLGIDFGLHLLTHFGAERQEGHSPEEAVLRTLIQLRSSLFVAALTTACGFAALMAAAFRGFAQLGQFATVGILCALLSALLTFPPLVLGLHKIYPREGAFTRAWKIPKFYERGLQRGPALWITSLGLVAFVGSLYLLPQLSLRQDLKSLVEQADSHGTRFREALSGTSRGAVLILADDPESLERAAQGLRVRFPSGLSEPEAKPGASIKDAKGAAVITPGTFIPDKQEEKLSHIALLDKKADDAMRFGDDDLKEKLKPWLPLLKLKEPLRREDLPEWVSHSLKERDGTFGTVGLTYQDYPGSHAGKMLELSHKLDKLRADHPHVRFASSSAVLGEVMPLLRQDGWRVTGLALLGLLIATLLIGRSRRRTTLILMTIFLAVAATAGLMVLMDWKIDFYNLLVFPVAFGIGVDGAIYVVWSVLSRGERLDWTDLPVSARAVFGSTMTTFVVFASLATSENGGLASLGQVGASSLLITLLANLVWLPAALSWLSYRVEAKRLAGQTTVAEAGS